MPDSYSSRGFAQYKTVEDSDHSTEVRVYESSSAEGRFVWLNLKGEAHLDEAPRPFVGIRGGIAAGSLSAHLSVEQAKAVRDALDEFITEAEAEDA